MLQHLCLALVLWAAVSAKNPWDLSEISDEWQDIPLEQVYLKSDWGESGLSFEINTWTGSSSSPDRIFGFFYVECGRSAYSGAEYQGAIRLYPRGIRITGYTFMNESAWRGIDDGEDCTATGDIYRGRSYLSYPEGVMDKSVYYSPDYNQYDINGEWDLKLNGDDFKVFYNGSLLITLDISRCASWLNSPLNILETGNSIYNLENDDRIKYTEAGTGETEEDICPTEPPTDDYDWDNDYSAGSKVSAGLMTLVTSLFILITE